MPTKKIMIATDIPFWNMSDGAQQRIASLYRFLNSHHFELQVFYLGSIEPDDQPLIDRSGINVVQNSSDSPPEYLLNRIGWFADATIHQATNWLKTASQGVAQNSGPVSLTLKDFDWPWAKTRFAERVAKFRPDVIIFEYVKTGYLLDALTGQQRQQIKCLVDTHDVLHLRAQQFSENGFPHWIEIDRDQECEVLNKFDVILAIQPKEADTFREMAPNVETITVGHAVELPSIAVASKSEPDHKIRVGYIGSKNFSNWQAIRDFLDNAWPVVVGRNPDDCELLVAGGICEWIDQPDHQIAEHAIQSHRLQNVTLLGKVDAIEDFYSQIDVLINPVEFGTGLKIKNAEALSFGKLLITTTHGFDGMPQSTRLACRIVDNVHEMGEAINSILQDRTSIGNIQTLATELAQTEFSERFAYAELHYWLQRGAG